MGNRDLCLLGVECFFEMDSVVVEHEGWPDVIDQARWSFLDPRTDLLVGLLKIELQK